MDNAKEGAQAPDKMESAGRWKDELRLAKKYFDKWTDSGLKIVKRYRDEEDAAIYGSRLNIFWASNEYIKPALFSKSPKVQTERRFKDGDPIGRAAATMLERATDYSIEAHQDFTTIAKSARDDFLLPGRGTLWERYVPYTSPQEKRVGLQIANDGDGHALMDGSPYEGKGEVQTDDQGAFVMEQVDALVYEESVTDYVYWRDFLHNPTRAWSEVRWVARRAFMTDAEIKERFNRTDVPLDFMPREVESDKELSDAQKVEFKKAAVWEIWDKPSKKVFWVSEGCDEILDVKDDPLELKDFFPCARPLYATLTSDSLIPRPFFTMSAHQADEVDRITARLSALVDSIRASGVSVADFPEVQRLFKEDTIVALKEWTLFAERGGFDGVMQFTPIEPLIKAIKELIAARNEALQKYYEVSGWSDIIRGSTDPRETATAQGIKSQSASKRLQEWQTDVQRFLKDQIAIKAEIIATHFQPETLRLMTGYDFLPNASPEEFQAAVQLLKQDTMRCFRIDIETDSTIALDEQLEQEKRVSFIETVTQFIGSALPIIKETPEMLPFAARSVEFLARGFKVGREMESAIEQMFGQLQQSAQQAMQNPQPDPEMAALQAKVQADQVKAQADQQRAASQVQLEQIKLQLEQARVQLEQEKAVAELQMKQEQMQMDAALKEFEIVSKLEMEKEIAIQKAQVEAEQRQREHQSEILRASTQGSSASPTHLNINVSSGGGKKVVFGTDANGQRTAEVVEEQKNG